MNLKNNILVLLILLLSQVSIAQSTLLRNKPEQEPCNALRVCKTFYTPYSYAGVGASNNLSRTPCNGGEDNSVWFRIDIEEDGILIFTIIPVIRTDDYDWAIVKPKSDNCESFTSGEVVRCNFNTNLPVALEGHTGLNLTSTYTSVEGGTTGRNFNKYIDAKKGETYYLMINNYGSGGSPAAGFNLSFEGSTAKFNTTPPVQFASITNNICERSKKLVIKLEDKVKCSSVAVSDFRLSDGIINDVKAVGCEVSGGYTDQLELTFKDVLKPGVYNLFLQKGTDGNTLLNLCDIESKLDTLTFTIEDYTDSIKVDICKKMAPYDWYGVKYDKSGIYNRTFKSKAGCDSIVFLNLQVEDTIRTSTNVEICFNQLPYEWNGIKVNKLGKDTLRVLSTSISGCDSVSTLYINVTPIKQYREKMQVCSYALPFSWNGITIPVGTTSKDSFTTYLTTTASGCDSLTILDLTVFEITPSIISNDTNSCGPLLFKGVKYSTNTTIIDTVFNINGCDSVYNKLNIFIREYIPTIEVVEYLGCDSLVFRGKKYYTDTILNDTFTSIYGCDSLVINHEIKIQHFDLDLISQYDTIVAGEYVVLNTEANTEYSIIQWEPEFLFINKESKEQVIKPTSTFEYIAIGKSNYNCIDTAKLIVYVEELIPDFAMPNAFSPNGDGINDIFEPKFPHKTGYVINRFYVYNRWGNRVYSLENKRVQGWNGINEQSNTMADAGVYTYFIEVTFVNGKSTILKGDVTLIR